MLWSYSEDRMLSAIEVHAKPNKQPPAKINVRTCACRPVRTFFGCFGSTSGKNATGSEN